MNTHQACALLEIPVGASIDDVKKAFKKKAAEYHPDRNKAEDAEAKFKEVNEAYQLLEKHGTIPAAFSDVSSQFYNHSDHLAEELRRQMDQVFNNQVFNIHFGQPNRIPSEPIIVQVEVPFEMAVLGGKKEITYERSVKCEACSGGHVSSGGGKELCQKCGGQGKRKYAKAAFSSGDDKELPCTNCKGTGYISSSSQIPCSECSGSGVKKSVDTLRVSVPPGVQSGLRLILQGKGHYRLGGYYDNVLAVISVLPDHDMQLSGEDVISVVELNLLEALQGTKRKLRTVKGEKTLTFKPKTRHRDTVKVSGFGVPPNGTHTFIVNVSYPDDVTDLIRVLENKNEPVPEEISGVQS
jgi:molecular chaperone DnaJ